jgi:hypothetical protein
VPGNSSATTYRQNLEELCGFFIIERAVLDTTRRFLSSAEVRVGRGWPGRWARADCAHPSWRTHGRALWRA